MHRGPICTPLCAVALAAAAMLVVFPAWAQIPPAGACFVRDYDAAHLARNPQQGVAGLRLWFYDAVRGDPAERAVVVEARLADQGQAGAAGLGGRTLRSHLRCSEGPAAPAACHVDCDGGWFTLQPRADGGLEIATDHVAIGAADGCGGSVDLAEGGRRTVYRLAASPGACADLAVAHPIPRPGCWGTVSPDDPELGRLRILLRDEGPDRPDYTFPAIGGVAAFDFAALPTPQGPAAGLQLLWFWCSSVDGLCRADGDLRGALRLVPDGAGLRIEADEAVLLLDAAGSEADIAALLARNARLAPLPAKDCAGLDE